MDDQVNFNWPHVGNAHIKEFLEKSLKNDHINNTFVFNGPDNLGKTTAAYYFSKSLLCKELKKNLGPCEKCGPCLSFANKDKTEDDETGVTALHSDLYVVKRLKDKKNISIEQIRGFINGLSMTSFLGSYKIGIIKHADQLSKGAANALLKTLEEPRKKVVIILVTEDHSVLPTTIVSRSQVLDFRAVPTDIIHDYLLKNSKATHSQAKNYSRLALGRPALAVKFFEDKNFYDVYIERAKVFLNFFRQDINSRFRAISEILPEKIKGQEAKLMADRILQNWEGILRDAMLANFNLGNLLQHEVIQVELNSLKNVMKPSEIPLIFEIIREAKENLSANVSPRLALENVAVKI